MASPKSDVKNSHNPSPSDGSTAPGGEHSTAPGGEHSTAPGGEHSTAPGGEHSTAPGGEHSTAPEAEYYNTGSGYQQFDNDPSGSQSRFNQGQYTGYHQFNNDPSGSQSRFNRGAYTGYHQFNNDPSGSQSRFNRGAHTGYHQFNNDPSGSQSRFNQGEHTGYHQFNNDPFGRQPQWDGTLFGKKGKTADVSRVFFRPLLASAVSTVVTNGIIAAPVANAFVPLLFGQLSRVLQLLWDWFFPSSRPNPHEDATTEVEAEENNMAEDQPYTRPSRKRGRERDGKRDIETESRAQRKPRRQTTTDAERDTVQDEPEEVREEQQKENGKRESQGEMNGDQELASQPDRQTDIIDIEIASYSHVNEGDFVRLKDINITCFPPMTGTVVKVFDSLFAAHGFEGCHQLTEVANPDDTGFSVFVRRNQFEVLSSRSISLQRLMLIESIPQLANDNSMKKAFAFEEEGIEVLLKSRQTERYVVLVSCRLASSDRPDLQLLQMNSLASDLDRASSDTLNVQFVVSMIGDLKRGSTAYKLIADGLLDDETIQALTAIKVVEEEGKEGKSSLYELFPQLFQGAVAKLLRFSMIMGQESQERSLLLYDNNHLDGRIVDFNNPLRAVLSFNRDV